MESPSPPKPRNDPHAAPSPGASDAAPTGPRPTDPNDPTDSAANPPGSHAPERRWLSRLWVLPFWLLLAGIDAVVVKQILAESRTYGGPCGTGALQRFVLLSLAGCLFALLALLQVDLHRRTDTPVLHADRWLVRLPIVVGVALFLAYFLGIPTLLRLIPSH